MGKGGFRDLEVWRRSKDLAVKIYNISSVGTLGKDYSLREQLRRAAVSVASNIAEGDERGSDKEAVRFFYIAKGSLAELRTQLEIACEIGYLSSRIFDEIDGECEQLGRMIGSLIKVRCVDGSLD